MVMSFSDISCSKFCSYHLFFLLVDLLLVGCRIDELNIRIPATIKSIGSYDSFEIENKLTDHLLSVLINVNIRIIFKYFL